MTNVVPPGDIFEAQVVDGDYPDIMGAAERADIAQTGAPMMVTGARTSVVTKYGESVAFDVTVGGNGPRRGQVWALLLKANDIRVRQAEAMIRALAMPNTDAVGPVYLAQIQTKSGQSAWVLQNDPHIGAVASAPEQRSEPVAVATGGSGVIADDDIPF